MKTIRSVNINGPESYIADNTKMGFQITKQIIVTGVRSLLITVCKVI